MHLITKSLEDLYNRTPRRHNDDNVREINAIITEYEDLLIEIEAINSYYEKQIPTFFNAVEEVKINIKKSNDKKASKKNKDGFFDDASGDLKDNIQQLITLFGDGNKTA
jgi:hypothetical protein